MTRSLSNFKMDPIHPWNRDSFVSALCRLRPARTAVREGPLDGHLFLFAFHDSAQSEPVDAARTALASSRYHPHGEGGAAAMAG